VDTLFLERYINLILSWFFPELTEEEKLRLVKVVASWFPRAHVVWFLFAGKLENKVHKRNPDTSHEVEEDIPEEISRISPVELQRVNQNVFLRCNACLRAQGKHFQHVLWTGKFLSKLILFSYIAFAMARFPEGEPELPGARQCAWRPENKITPCSTHGGRTECGRPQLYPAAISLSRVL
jgi:hypothetical protein